MASGDPVHFDIDQQANGPVSNYGFKLGDQGYDVNMVNPGMMDPSRLNPSAAGYINNLQGIQGQYGDIANNFLNNNYYDQMKAYTGQQAQTAVDNNFARLGMAGSSAAAGAGMQAQLQNYMGWDQKRLQDATLSANTLAGLNQRGYQDTMGVQGQYGQYQNSMADAYINMLNAQQAQANSSNQLWGSMIQGGLTGAGMAMGAL